MPSDLLVITTIAPFVAGIALAVVVGMVARRDPACLIATALSFGAIYVMLEGLPPLLPVSAKQKLAYLLVAAPVWSALAPRLNITRSLGTALFLAASLGWLGQAKLAQPGGLAAMAFLLVPVSAAALGSLSLKRSDPDRFVWPLCLTALAIGGSVLSLLGSFVGFAQVAGAFAACIGGYLSVRYVLRLLGKDRRLAPLTADALGFLILAFPLVLIVIGLFAPGISHAGVIALSASLLMPLVVPALAGWPGLVRPILQGLIAAIPCAIALTLALLLS